MADPYDPITGEPLLHLGPNDDVHFDEDRDEWVSHRPPAESVPAAEPPTRHRLKVWPQFYAAMADGDKPFEVRLNDRNFHVGDWLDLCEWDNAWTGAACTRTVTYVLDLAAYFHDQGCTAWPANYVVLGLGASPESPAAEPVPVPMVTVRRDRHHWTFTARDLTKHEAIRYDELVVPADQIPEGWEPVDG